MTAMKVVCPGCNGSGQINFFKGVSRFLLSCEECPECAGLGFRLDPEALENFGDESNSSLSHSQRIPESGVRIPEK